MRPLTKWNVRVAEPATVPEAVRKAFKVAESEKPGATHLELPEDVMGAALQADPLPRRDPVHHRLRHALQLDVPSMVVLPIDASVDVAKTG